MTGDEVLISSPKCGMLNASLMTPEDRVSAVLGYSSQLKTASAAYSQQCYCDVSEQECSVFVQRQMPRQLLLNASCPFPGKDTICVRNATNLRMDTGLINSNEHFGMNAPPRDQFSYRNILECGQLRTDNYRREVTVSDSQGNHSSVQYLYGSPAQGLHQNDSVTFSWPTTWPSELQTYMIK